MKTVAHTLEQLDNTLDTVEQLIHELPISNEGHRQLTSLVYELWMQVEATIEQKEVDTVAE